MATAASSPQVETRAFQAETKRLLDLVIHSLYTHKEIFLRELISNASDALDRLRFEALTQPELLGENEELGIRIETNKTLRTLTISDNGVGMRREEVVENLGSIAKSGAKELVDRLKAQQGGETPPELIGNFGVGFYSAFMVADKVEVETLRAGAGDAVRWESKAEGEFTVSPGSRRTRGTSITLYLKQPDSETGVEDYTDPFTIERIVKRYSDFITHPIKLKIQREKKESDEKASGETEVVTPDGASSIVTEEKTLNSRKPIWARPESEIDEDEFNEFYRQIAADWEDPLARLSLRAEGVSEYQSLLFFPAHGPQDLYLYGAEYGLRLYAKRVLIDEQCDELLPRYLRFVRGVVDSADLPLNVGRQTLQENRHIAQIRRWLTKKILEKLADLQKNDRKTYLKLWNEFGRALKEGVSADFGNKDKLVALLLFESSKHGPDDPTTLSDYVERMPDDQREIFYLSGESRAMCEHSPLLEAFKSKGYEVLFFTDPIDEIMIQYLPEFEGKKLKSIARGEVNLGSEEEKKQAEEELKKAQDETRGLLEALRQKLEENVKQVRLSNRLTESPACLAADEDDMTPTMERIIRMSGGEDAPRQKRILELNPKHEIVGKLRKRYEADKEDPELTEYAELLYGYAALAEGLELPDPVRFNKLLANLMTRAV